MTYDPGFDEVREGQQVFRKLLNATAWPGTIEILLTTRVSALTPWPHTILQIARTLLDAQVTFAVHSDDGDALADYLVSNAGARRVPLAKASYVIAGHPLGGLDVMSLHAGTLLEPDRGATLLLACDELANDEHRSSLRQQNGSERAGPSASDRTGVAITLRGRGIADRRVLLVDQAVASVLARLSERDDEYPLGVDLILADQVGRIVSLPRTTRWSKEAVQWAT